MIPPVVGFAEVEPPLLTRSTTIGPASGVARRVAAFSLLDDDQFFFGGTCGQKARSVLPLFDQQPANDTLLLGAW